MNGVWHTVTLDSLAVLRARGADTVAFLQGQLSNDVSLLAAERSLLAGYHNPQGRVIALLRLLSCAPQEVLALVPRELAATVASRLTKFILRSKVQLSDESAHWRIRGVFASATTPPARWPVVANAATRLGETQVVCVGVQPLRWLLLAPASAASADQAPPGAQPAAPEDWLRLMVAAGEPQVYAATSEEFVAQMLNLDALGAIAFDKGCYTGQEVIARAHYRGRVKRRLQRFRTHEAAVLRPGAAGELDDGRSFKVVQAVAHAEGGCEFLAVTTVGSGDTVAHTPRSAGARAASVIHAAQLPLPYPLPE